MSKGRGIRCYDYVNHPYEQVRDELTKRAVTVFHEATKLATSRAGAVASELRVKLGGIEIGADIAISVKEVKERPAEVTSTPATRLQLEWEAASSPRLFPFMRAELYVYPLTATETQLDFSGRYEPPLGVLGGAMNAVVGHRIAEASVHRFLAEVARHLKKTLSERSAI